ncbi:TPA: lipoprotein [Klebsiella pneumoniae]
MRRILIVALGALLLTACAAKKQMTPMGVAKLMGQ